MVAAQRGPQLAQGDGGGGVAEPGRPGQVGQGVSPAGPRRQGGEREPGDRGPDRAVRDRRPRWPTRFPAGDHRPGGGLRRRGDGQHRPHPPDVGQQGRPVPRHLVGLQTGQGGDPDLFGDVPVLFARGQRQASPRDDLQERGDQADVHPAEQARVLRGVGTTGPAHSRDPGVDGAQPGAGQHRLGGRAERGDPDVLGGAGQPLPGVPRAVAAPVDGRHRLGVQGLQQQGAQPGDPHQRIAVQPPGDGVAVEQPAIGVAPWPPGGADHPQPRRCPGRRHSRRPHRRWEGTRCAQGLHGAVPLGGRAAHAVQSRRHESSARRHLVPRAVSSCLVAVRVPHHDQRDATRS